MPSGRVKWFNSKKGYGFITLDDDSEKDVFLHVSAFEKSKFRILKENQKIQFEIKEERGKLQAINLKNPINNYRGVEQSGSSSGS